MSLLSASRAWSAQGLKQMHGVIMSTKSKLVLTEQLSSVCCCARQGCNQIVHRIEEETSVPFYDGKDICSRFCLRLLLTSEIHRLAGQGARSNALYSHRMPLGLLMLERRWITTDQLSLALLKQSQEKQGRLGDWLIAIHAADEATVAKAIALQWGVPLLMQQEVKAQTQNLLPKLIVEAFDIVPVRTTPDRVLYLGINDRVDHCLNLAIEKMTGMRVEPLVMTKSAFKKMKDAMLQSEVFGGRMFRASTLNDLCASVDEIVSDKSYINIQLASLKEYIWLRSLRKRSARSAKSNVKTDEIEDILFTVMSSNRELCVAPDD